jgi:hypothetical protein
MLQASGLIVFREDITVVVKLANLVISSICYPLFLHRIFLVFFFRIVNERW